MLVKTYPHTRLDSSSTLFTCQCALCDNDGVGKTVEKGAVVTVEDCVVERNGPAPTKEEHDDVLLHPPEPALIASH